MSELRCGNRVRQRREELGLSRERLAVNSEVSTSTIARLELADKLPGSEALIRIASTLRVSLDYLVADTKASA